MHPPQNDLKWITQPAVLRWLIFGSLLTFLLVYFITSPLIVKARYASETLVFVPLTLFHKQYDQQGIGFGSNAEIDGHIQILQSSRLLDSLDHRFGLMEEWNLSRKDPRALSAYYSKMRKRMQVEKTRYGSVLVRMHSPDAEKSAQLANAVVALGDIIKQDILLENRLIALDFARDLYQKKQEEIAHLEARMGISDTLPDLKDKDDLPLTYRQRTVYEAELYELTALRNHYERLSKSLEIDLPKVYVISPAIPSHEAVWPPRLLLALAGSIGFLLLYLAVQILKRSY
jgi:hypothetical protein